jgi:hypothetical protein
MKPLIATAAISLLSGCANFFPPEGLGDRHLITQNDVHEIQLLVAQRSDIVTPIDYITVIAADRVFVETGHPASEWLSNTFLAQKRHGHWTIIDASIRKTGRIIVTS